MKGCLKKILLTWVTNIKRESDQIGKIFCSMHLEHDILNVGLLGHETSIIITHTARFRNKEKLGERQARIKDAQLNLLTLALKWKITFFTLEEEKKWNKLRRKKPFMLQNLDVENEKRHVIKYLSRQLYKPRNIKI